MYLFRSATLKLTVWYLAILMSISIAFSLVIYQLNYQEVSNRLQDLQHSLVDSMGLVLSNTDSYGYGPGTPFYYEAEKAGSQMAWSLFYINLVVFIAGGLGSYLLARRSLKPIEMAHEAQSRFTSDASHELRTPLAAMKAELEVTLRDARLELPEAKEVLGSNLEEVNKLIQLSEMLLRLARLEHDELERTNIDLVAVFNDVIKRLAVSKRRFDITARKKATTRANEAAITELISVLVDNAIKFSPSKSKIYVKIFQQRGRIGFTIKNSGTPIPEALLPKLFNRFFRSDTSRTESSKNGYGLGLSIAKRIVEIHHGEITASSNKDGNSFTFFIPIVTRGRSV